MTLMAKQEREKNWKMLFSVSTKPPQPTAWRSVPRRPTWWQTPVASTQRSKWMDSHRLQVPGLNYKCWGCKLEILPRIAQTTAALTRQTVWSDRSISFSSKTRLIRSFVTSIFLYAFEPWTVSAELQRRIQAIGMRCYRKILHISYKFSLTDGVLRPAQIHFLW